MSKFAHDDFCKTYLKELLITIGKATASRPLKSETRAADLWFEPGQSSEEARSHLGLLSRLLPRDTLIEVFRNPATGFEIRSCKGKLYSLEAELLRKAKRQKQSLSEDKLPSLLLLMPTASQEIRDGFGAIQTGTSGVYLLPSEVRTTLVAVHQLPRTRDTLWLRILGRSGNQKRAIEEFADLGEAIPLYASIGEILADYQANLESRRKLTEEEEELIMNLSAAYLRKREEWKDEGKIEVARNLLRQGMTVEFVVQATELTIEQIEQLRDQL
jgi:hypothetical protein